MQSAQPNPEETATPTSTLNTPPQLPPSWGMWLVEIWLAGVTLMLLRVIRAVALVGRIRRGCRPLTDAALRATAEELRVALGVARRVGLLISDKILTPCVVGVLWPAILIPSALLPGLPPEQLRAILAHELAHIRRHDTLVNMFQRQEPSFSLLLNFFAPWRESSFISFNSLCYSSDSSDSSNSSTTSSANRNSES